MNTVTHIFRAPAFKVGDTVVVRSLNNKLGRTENHVSSRFLYDYAKITYIHPTNGWSTYNNGCYSDADWNAEIYTLQDWEVNKPADFEPVLRPGLSNI